MAAGAATGAGAGFLSKTSDIVLEEATRSPSFVYSKVRHLPPLLSPDGQNIESCEIEGRDVASTTWDTFPRACGCEANSTAA